MSIAVQLAFDNGAISMKAISIGGPSAHVASSAILATEDGYVSAYFGKEASERYVAAASVQIEGETPLPVSLGAPAVVRFDRNLVSTRFYWRIAVD